MATELSVRIKINTDGTVQVDKAKTSFNKLDKTSKGLDSSLKRMAISMASVYAAWRTLQKGFTAVKASADLSAKFANIATLGDFTAESIENVRQKTLALALEIRKSPTDLAEGYYQAVSAGATHGAEALDLVRQSAILANAGITSTAVSVDAITNILNSYGKENISAAKASDLLIQVVRDGKTTLERYAPTVGKVANDAAALGIRFEEVAAASAQLTKTMPTEIAMTALAGALKGLTAASGDFKKANIDIFEVIQKRGLVGALEALDQVTGGNQEKMREWIGDMRGVRGILGLTGTGAESFNRILKNMENSTGASAEAFRKQSDELSAYGEQIKITTEIMKIKLGDIITKNETVRQGFKLIADDYRNAVNNMGKNTSALNENISNSFIFIVRAGQKVIESFVGIGLAFRSLVLAVKNAGDEHYKYLVGGLILENNKAMENLIKSYNKGEISQEQYFKQANILDAQLDSLKNSYNQTDDGVVKMYNDLVKQAEQVEATRAAFAGLIAKLKETKDALKMAPLAAPPASMRGGVFVGPPEPTPEQRAVAGVIPKERVEAWIEELKVMDQIAKERRELEADRPRPDYSDWADSLLQAAEEEAKLLKKREIAYKNLTERISNNFGTFVVRSISDFGSALMPLIHGAELMEDTFVKVGNTIIDMFIAMIAKATAFAAINALTGGALGTGESGGGLFMGIGRALGFADGGIVPGDYIGQPRLAVVHAGEEIRSVGQINSGAVLRRSKNVTNNWNLEFHVSALNPKQVNWKNFTAKHVMPAIRENLRDGQRLS